MWDAALVALPLAEYTFFTGCLDGGHADVTCTRCLGKSSKRLSVAVELGGQMDMREVLEGMLRHEAEQHGGIPYE